SRCAESALQTVMLTEGLLHGVQRTIRLSQALNGGDLGAFTLQCERSAGFDRNALDMNDTSAALRGVTADMGAGEPQVFTQELHQEGAGFAIPNDGFGVPRHRYARPGLPPNLGQTPSFPPARPERWRFTCEIEPIST